MNQLKQRNIGSTDDKIAISSSKRFQGQIYVYFYKVGNLRPLCNKLEPPVCLKIQEYPLITGVSWVLFVLRVYG